ncbi:family 10 glycosylhydrolase [Aureibaculum conchae]|uniref:family 10 glycosylhydrolase n=1 Tax=Aureibaculum sp. 2308TA14-22 TaxID=3108392 RepID=UPI0033969048
MSSTKRFLFQYILLFTTLSSLLVISCEPKHDKTVETRGVYGHPKPLWDKGYNLNDLGINAVFVHGGSVDKEMVDRATSEGMKVFAEYATLNGKNYVETHPEAWAINEKGEKVEAATWFMGVCPTEPGFREYRFKQLRDLLKFDLDGIFMDYVHWHAQFEDSNPILPETCFCDGCLRAFAKYSGLEIPDEIISKKSEWILNNHDEKWRNWRCKVIYDWTYEVKSIIKEIKPEVLLGLYHCPWDDEEFDGARRRILGLDYDLLKETVDVFSPMVYHAKMGREPDWVKENIEWFSNKLTIGKNSYPKIWPIIQAHNSPSVISNEDFETALMAGLAGKSTGVMMFTTSAVAEDEGKIEVMKRVYNKLKKKTKN